MEQETGKNLLNKTTHLQEAEIAMPCKNGRMLLEKERGIENSHKSLEDNNIKKILCLLDLLLHPGFIEVAEFVFFLRSTTTYRKGHSIIGFWFILSIQKRKQKIKLHCVTLRILLKNNNILVKSSFSWENSQFLLFWDMKEYDKIIPEYSRIFRNDSWKYRNILEFFVFSQKKKWGSVDE